MYASSTQKNSWTFVNQTELDSHRIEANKLYQSKCRKFLESSHNEDLLLTPDEEALLRKVFTQTGIRLDFDLDLIRPHSTEFFKKSLVGDAMLLYAPSQIALAALKYGLEQTDSQKSNSGPSKHLF
uniref:Cyclin C-terminal domain-containing protein n=1 Tax=Ditylenchus dipsaci TaxID=166011 RepID=A0A915EWH0_9BILA